MTEPAFRILTVCTGNICRSPVAERLLQAALGDGVQIRSAGVRALVGAPIDPAMVTLLDGQGVRADGFAARRLAPAEVRGAGLVLAMTRAHRAQIVEAVPSALRRCFTLLEFARIAGSPDLPAAPAGPPGVRMPALVALAGRHRGAGGAPDDEDVPDPYGRGTAAFEHAYALIRDAVQDIAQVARG